MGLTAALELEYGLDKGCYTKRSVLEIADAIFELQGATAAWTISDMWVLALALSDDDVMNTEL